MKVLLIGSGSIGQRHIHNLLQCDKDAHIVVLRQSMVKDEFVERVKASIISSWQDLPNDIDFVIVANPSSLHAQHIEKIIERNLPAYIEKPLVTSRQALEKIKQLITTYQYNQPVMMGCNLRFLSSIIKIKEILREGVLGNLCRVFIEAGSYLPNWRPNKDYTQSYSAKESLGGGVIFDLTHELDMVRYLFGECEVLSSFYGHFSHLDIEVEDTAVIHLGKTQGPLISVHLDYVSRFPSRTIKIVGDEKTLHWDLMGKKLQLQDQDEIRLVAADPHEFDVSLTYQSALKEFLECIKNKKQTSQGILEGIKTTELVLQCKHC